MNSRSSKLTFFRITQFSCALGLGVFAGFVWSIQEITPAFRLALTFGSGVAFVIGAVAGAKFWKMAWTARGGKTDPKLKWKFLLWGIAFSIFTFSSFAYGLRGQTHENLVGYAIGTGTAVIFLSIVGFLLYSVAKYFNTDETKDPKERELP